MKTLPKEKLKSGQEPFVVFMTNVSHQREDMANEIHHKGHKMPKFIAWRKYLSYFRMMQDPDIKLVAVDNKPIKQSR